MIKTIITQDIQDIKSSINYLDRKDKEVTIPIVRDEKVNELCNLVKLATILPSTKQQLSVINKKIGELCSSQAGSREIGFILY